MKKATRYIAVLFVILTGLFLGPDTASAEDASPSASPSVSPSASPSVSPTAVPTCQRLVVALAESTCVTPTPTASPTTPAATVPPSQTPPAASTTPAANGTLPVTGDQTGTLLTFGILALVLGGVIFAVRKLSRGNQGGIDFRA